ncbi:MAG: hypothetical protein O7G28_00035 [Deltaproteobacteria bacterium]|nr:hypothetical protein [Deltaproteobacteria bacterium]
MTLGEIGVKSLVAGSNSTGKSCRFSPLWSNGLRLHGGKPHRFCARGKPRGYPIIDFSETSRSAFLGRYDISIEKEDRSLYLRALLPDTEDTLFVVGESGSTYEINLSTSDNPDQTVLIPHTPKSLEVQAERVRQAETGRESFSR